MQIAQMQVCRGYVAILSLSYHTTNSIPDESTTTVFALFYWAKLFAVAFYRAKLLAVA